MTHLTSLLKNKLILQKNFNLQEHSINNWPFWMLEENIKIANEIIEDEEKNRKKQEETQAASQPNFNTSSIMNNMNNITNKFR